MKRLLHIIFVFLLWQYAIVAYAIPVSPSNAITQEAEYILSPQPFNALYGTENGQEYAFSLIQTATQVPSYTRRIRNGEEPNPIPFPKGRERQETNAKIHNVLCLYERIQCLIPFSQEIRIITFPFASFW